MERNGIDLSTSYMGFELRNPIVPSAGPYSADISKVRELEDNGAAAIVLYSLFEEEVDHDVRELLHYFEHGGETYSEAASYFPEVESFRAGPDEYLEHLARLKQAVGIPVIASLNGTDPGEWTRYARRMEQAGADGIELNIYHLEADPTTSGPQVEERYLEVLRDVRSRVRIPVAVKLGPFFSSLAHFARRLTECGANALVLFNRFYQPEIDLENREVLPNVVLSTPADFRLPLRWTAILYGRVAASLGFTGGIDRHEHVLKALMVGADVTMVCSAILRHGTGQLKALLDGVCRWMEEHEYGSVEELKGSMSHLDSSDPSAFERACYMRALNSYRT